MKTTLADRIIQKEKAQRQAVTRRLWRRVALLTAVCVGIVVAIGLFCFLPILLFWGPVIFGSSQTHVTAAYEDLPQKAQEFATPEGSDFVFHNMYSGSKVAMRYSCTQAQFESWAEAKQLELLALKIGDRVHLPVLSGRNPSAVKGVELKQDVVFGATSPWRAGVVSYIYFPDQQEVIIWASGW